MFTKGKSSLQIIFVATILCLGCQKKKQGLEKSLKKYLKQNKEFTISNELIACAASNSVSVIESTGFTTSIFFYPVSGATEFKYFETKNDNLTENQKDFYEKDLSLAPVFNGYLWKFNNTAIQNSESRLGIVTYKVDKTIHICTAIQLKHNTNPTEYNSSAATITENGITPCFNWSDGTIKENVIYFQVISDSLNNLISGTYTLEKNFCFYDLSNVTLNIKDEPTPFMIANKQYNFTLMAVSEDNWVNLIANDQFNSAI